MRAAGAVRAAGISAAAVRLAVMTGPSLIYSLCCHDYFRFYLAGLSEENFLFTWGRFACPLGPGIPARALRPPRDGPYVRDPAEGDTA
jgi:hypothetical protein